MKSWKVNTCVDLIIETNYLNKKKRQLCYFTYNTRYVYAENIDEAKTKYYDYFYIPTDYTKKSLSYYKLIAESKSINMNFNLAFNQKIIYTNELILCNENIITDATVNVIFNSLINDNTQVNTYDVIYH